MKRLIPALSLAAVFAIPATAEPEMRLAPEVAGLVRGLICAPPEGGRREAPDTSAGWIHVPATPIEILQEGATAPALLGTGFGVRYTLEGAGAPLPVRYIVGHPPLPPAGITRQSWESFVLPGTPEQGFFQFDLEQELQPGSWSFAAQSGSRELFHVTFDVVAPETVPHLTGLCRGANLLAVSRISPGGSG
ncbi:MAG TPA: DUF3859 domain-containing protein [Paracoccus sp.]|nr:DUF3859 domain-containing protein [Paracoccus sp. (in: a-proteobacteria)]